MTYAEMVAAMHQEIRMYGVQSPYINGLGRCYRRTDNREKWESVYIYAPPPKAGGGGRFVIGGHNVCQYADV
jgi:sortase (surface protein transpeptidase)